MSRSCEYRELEKKYGIEINYPGMCRIDIRTKIMTKFCWIYVALREKTKNIIPLTQNEELYAEFRKKPSMRAEDNSPLNAKDSFYENKYIHMFDFIPKENMGKLEKEIENLQKKYTSMAMGVGNQCERIAELKSFVPGRFVMPTYSLGIKKDSSLYEYISAIYIGFQELTTSLNTVLYTVVLNKELVEKLNNIYIDNIGEHYLLETLNLKWYQFYKMGWSAYSGSEYKRGFINACLRSIKWNVVQGLKKHITFYLVDNEEILPSVNVFKTNIDGNSSPKFWNSIGVSSPRRCDYYKRGSACINWSSESGDIDYIYMDLRGQGLQKHIFPMDIRYYYSQYLVRNTIVNQTYARVGKYMETCDFYNRMHYKLRKWLAYKAKMEKELLCYKRFYNEQEENMYDSSEFNQAFISIMEEDNISITEKLIKEQFKKTNKASEVLNQAIKYIDTNIEYRSSTENFKIQKETLLLTFISMSVATLALMATCMGNEEISGFLVDKFKWVLIIMGGILGVCIVIRLAKWLYRKNK